MPNLAALGGQVGGVRRMDAQEEPPARVFFRTRSLEIAYRAAVRVQVNVKRGLRRRLPVRDGLVNPFVSRQRLRARRRDYGGFPQPIAFRRVLPRSHGRRRIAVRQLRDHHAGVIENRAVARKRKAQVAMLAWAVRADRIENQKEGAVVWDVFPSAGRTQVRQPALREIDVEERFGVRLGRFKPPPLRSVYVAQIGARVQKQMAVVGRKKVEALIAVEADGVVGAPARAMPTITSRQVVVHCKVAGESVIIYLPNRVRMDGDALFGRNLADGAHVRHDLFRAFRRVRVLPYLRGLKRRQREYGRGERGDSDCERAAETRPQQTARANQRADPQRQRQTDKKHPLVRMVFGECVAPRRQRPAEPHEGGGGNRGAESAGDERQRRQRRDRRRASQSRPRGRRRFRLRRGKIAPRKPLARVRRDGDAGAMELPEQEVSPLGVGIVFVSVRRPQALHHGPDRGQV